MSLSVFAIPLCRVPPFLAEALPEYSVPEQDEREVKDVQADPQPSAEQSEPRQDTGKRGKCLRWNREGMICFFPCCENVDEKEDGRS